MVLAKRLLLAAALSMCSEGAIADQPGIYQPGNGSKSGEADTLRAMNNPLLMNATNAAKLIKAGKVHGLGGLGSGVWGADGSADAARWPPRAPG